MALQSWQQTLVSAQVAGTALTAATNASCLPAQAKFTLPANFIDTIGKQLLVRASGIVSTVITTPGTLRFDVRFGGVVVADSQAILPDSTVAYTTVGWWLEMLMTFRVVGAAANCMMQGIFVSTDIAGQPATPPKGALTAILPWNVNPPVVGANYDATTAQQVDLQFTQTAATGSLQLQQYSLISLN